MGTTLRLQNTHKTCARARAIQTVCPDPISIGAIVGWALHCGEGHSYRLTWISRCRLVHAAPFDCFAQAAVEIKVLIAKFHRKICLSLSWWHNSAMIQWVRWDVLSASNGWLHLASIGREHRSAYAFSNDIKQMRLIDSEIDKSLPCKWPCICICAPRECESQMQALNLGL